MCFSLFYSCAHGIRVYTYVYIQGKQRVKTRVHFMVNNNILRNILLMYLLLLLHNE